MLPATSRVLELADADATVALGARLAQALTADLRPVWVSLRGDLGAGKTTLARGLLRAFGHAGNVKSPTYTLIEPYALADVSVYHLDLYRLADPEELEFLGVRELGEGNAIVLVEWAQRGQGFLPALDLELTLSLHGDGRRAQFTAQTPRGAAILATLETPA